MKNYLRILLADAQAAPDGPYKDGYVDAVELILEEVEYREA